jgi:FkbM family methyltransferase
VVSIVRRCAFKLEQIFSFIRDTKTPINLVLDTLKLKRRTFVAVNGDGIKLKLEPRCGESFTFFETLVRRDYLVEGVSLQPGDTVVDVGANIGSFTVLAASAVGINGRVLSFEPVPETFRRLQENVSLNGLQNVRCSQTAVEATSNGQIKLYSAKKPSYSTAYIDMPGATEVDVQTITLDHALRDGGLDRVSLLKIDCEGGEYGIFSTMTESTAAKIDKIAMEIHIVRGQSVEALIQRMDQLGFDVVHHGPLFVVAFNRLQSSPLKR